MSHSNSFKVLTTIWLKPNPHKVMKVKEWLKHWKAYGTVTGGNSGITNIPRASDLKIAISLEPIVKNK